MGAVARAGRVGLQVALLVSVAGPVRAQTPPPWAEEQLAAWYKAFNAGDARAVAALYAADAVVVPAGKPPVRGRTAIEAYQVAALRETRFACSGGFGGFQVVSGTAVGWGRDDCQETARAGGAARTTKSRWLIVYERQGDGTWLIARDVGEAVGP